MSNGVKNPAVFHIVELFNSNFMLFLFLGECHRFFSHGAVGTASMTEVMWVSQYRHDSSERQGS